MAEGGIRAILHSHDRTNAAILDGATPQGNEAKILQAQADARHATAQVVGVFQEKFGHQLDVLANPHSSPGACVVAMASLAKEIGKVATPEGFASGAADVALKLMEDKYPQTAKALEQVKGGAEALKDLKEMGEDLRHLKEAGPLTRGWYAHKLESHGKEFDKHMHEATGKEIHSLHAMAPGAPGAQVAVASPLDQLEVGRSASIANGQHGPSVQQHVQQRQTAAMGLG